MQEHSLNRDIAGIVSGLRVARMAYEEGEDVTGLYKLGSTEDAILERKDAEGFNPEERTAMEMGYGRVILEAKRRLGTRRQAQYQN